MKRIGVTQRVSTMARGQPHDCLDSAWSALLFSFSYAPVPLPNIDLGQERICEYLNECGLSGLILSGGNDIAGFGEVKGSEVSIVRDRFERAAIDWAVGAQVPILAVCRGMQLLNLHLGGGLTAVEGHAGVTHSVHRASASAPEFFGDPPESMAVNSYHNFAIAPDDLAPELEALFLDEQGFVEAAYGVRKRMVGVMWHPERARPAPPFDLTLIERLFD